MRIVPFHVEHLDALEVDLSHNEDARDLLRENPQAMTILAAGAWSMEHMGAVVACGGKVPHPDGTVWWIAMSRKALDRPLSLTREVKRHLDAECKDGLHFAHAVDLHAGRWLETLGFRSCGVEHGRLLYVRGT